MINRPQITQIKGLSESRRLPRLGIIRLGIKKKSEKSGKEYPAETDHFVVPKEVAKIYGNRPKELDVMIPVESLDMVFPVAYKYYGSAKGLICSGNGEIAYRKAKNGECIEDTQCPCHLLDDGVCKQSGTLNVILHKVSIGGVYQIRTSSINSIIDINSGLEYVQDILGRFNMVPLKLRREATETHHDDKKQKHYTLKINFEGNIDVVNALRADSQKILASPDVLELPPPIETNPASDPPDVIDMEDSSANNGYKTDDSSASKMEDRKGVTESCSDTVNPIKPMTEQQRDAILKISKSKKIDTMEVVEMIAWYAGDVPPTFVHGADLINNFDEIYSKFQYTKI